MVADADDHAAATGGGVDVNGWGAVANGVVDEVAHGLLEAQVVGAHAQAAAAQLHVRRAAGGPLEHRVEVELGLTQREPLGVRPRQHEQVVGEPSHAVDLLLG